MTFSRSAIQIRLYQGLRRIVLLLSATFYKKQIREQQNLNLKLKLKIFFILNTTYFFSFIQGFTFSKI